MNVADLFDLLESRVTWHREAACHGMGPEPWLPRRNQAENTGIPADAAICATCPINAQCREVGEAGSGWLLARRVDDVDAKRIRRRHQHHNWPTPRGQSA